MIDFLAFADDNTAIRARVELVGDRLSDLLAAGTPIAAQSVELLDLRTKARTTSGARSLEPERLVIVVATGPRGSLSRRVETRWRPVAMQAGRYLVHGFLHAPVPEDPLEHLAGRGWVPLTEAILEYQLAGHVYRERYETLLVNRRATAAMRVITEALHEVQWLASTPTRVFPEEPVRA